MLDPILAIRQSLDFQEFMVYRGTDEQIRITIQGHMGAPSPQGGGLERVLEDPR